MDSLSKFKLFICKRLQVGTTILVDGVLADYGKVPGTLPCNASSFAQVCTQAIHPCCIYVCCSFRMLLLFLL